MSDTLLETRRESELQVDKKRRYNEIIQILKDFKQPLPAKEISVEMKHRGYTPTDERNFASPRLTELLNKGIVEVMDKKLCTYTHKRVGTFRLKGMGE